MLVFLTALIVLIVGYAFWREGVLTAFCTTVNIFLAGLAAFELWEPLADELTPLFAGTFLAGYEDALCLTLTFSITLAVLRVVTNNLANRMLEYHPALQQGGAVLCALAAGYLLSGFLLCMLQTLPWSEQFMGFDPGIDANDSALRRVLPADRVWLALVHRASRGPFATSPTNTFDHEGSFELRYARLRRFRDQPSAPAAPVAKPPESP